VDRSELSHLQFTVIEQSLLVSLPHEIIVTGKILGKTYIHLYSWHIKAHLLDVFVEILTNLQASEAVDEDMGC